MYLDSLFMYMKNLHFQAREYAKILYFLRPGMTVQFVKMSTVIGFNRRHLIITQLMSTVEQMDRQDGGEEIFYAQ